MRKASQLMKSAFRVADGYADTATNKDVVCEMLMSQRLMSMSEWTQTDVSVSGTSSISYSG